MRKRWNRQNQKNLLWEGIRCLQLEIEVSGPEERLFTMMVSWISCVLRSITWDHLKSSGFWNDNSKGFLLCGCCSSSSGGDGRKPRRRKERNQLTTRRRRGGHNNSRWSLYANGQSISKGKVRARFWDPFKEVKIFLMMNSKEELLNYSEAPAFIVSLAFLTATTDHHTLI